MRQPAWLLLLWSALVASLVAAWLGVAARGRLQHRNPTRSALATLLLGVFVYAPIYGFIFEAIGSATSLVGALVGIAHGALQAVLSITVQRATAPSSPPDPASVHGRRVVARLVYGAIIGLLYVVPGA